MAAQASAQLRFLTDAAHLMRLSAPETSAYLMSRRMELAAAAAATTATTTTTTGATSAAASAASALSLLPQTDVQRQHVCTCCGHILIPGRDGTTLTIQPGRPAPKKANKRRQNQKGDSPAVPAATRVQKPHAGIAKVYACGLCHRETRIALPPPPPRRRDAKTAAKKGDTTKAGTAQKQLAAAASSTPVSTTTTPLKAAASPATATAPPPKTASNTNSKKRAKLRKAGLLALLDKSRGSESSGGGGLGGFSLSLDDFRKK